LWLSSFGQIKSHSLYFLDDMVTFSGLVASMFGVDGLY